MATALQSTVLKSTDADVLPNNVAGKMSFRGAENVSR